MSYLRQFFEIVWTPIRLLFTAPQKLVATPRKLLGLSLPARVAILVAIFLVVCVVAACVMLYLHQETFDQPWWTNLPLILLLVLVIPAVTYQALRLWLEGETSAFEDIDRAWKAGLAELERHGLDLGQEPIFLVLGSSGEAEEKALFEAARQSLTIRQFPPGPAALHWYANPDGIFVVASGVGCLSKLAAIGAAMAAETPSQPASLEPKPVARSVASIRGTTMPEDEPDPRPAAGAADFRGTMLIRQTLDPGEQALLAPAAAAERKHIKLSRDEVEGQPPRLEYLCRLIRRARQPLCPINGILTLLPYRVIQWGAAEGVEVQKAARSDLQTITRALKLRSPVTALVVGLESESGFRELVRRVGRERARAQRFGKGFGVWDQATPEQLGALCTHACGAFEDWVYTLFREKDALSKPGNTKLYALLCKIRRHLQGRLDAILAGGYARDPEQDPQGEPVLVGGCYFAATGETEDCQAFVKSVFDKLPEQQEELEWLDEALREDQRYRRIAYFGFALNAVLMVLLGALVWAK